MMAFLVRQLNSESESIPGSAGIRTDRLSLTLFSLLDRPRRHLMFLVWLFSIVQKRIPIFTRKYNRKKSLIFFRNNPMNLSIYPFIVVTSTSIQKYTSINLNKVERLSAEFLFEKESQRLSSPVERYKMSNTDTPQECFVKFLLFFFSSFNEFLFKYSFSKRFCIPMIRPDMNLYSFYESLEDVRFSGGLGKTSTKTMDL